MYQTLAELLPIQLDLDLESYSPQPVLMITLSNRDMFLGSWVFSFWCLDRHKLNSIHLFCVGVLSLSGRCVKTENETKSSWLVVNGKIWIFLIWVNWPFQSLPLDARLRQVYLLVYLLSGMCKPPLPSQMVPVGTASGPAAPSAGAFIHWGLAEHAHSFTTALARSLSQWNLFQQTRFLYE